MAALTERRLVSLLEHRFAADSPGVQLGIGDDAAVLAPAAEPWVCSVDASVEGVHFDTRFLGYEDIGFRAFQAAVSDLAAMGATPAAALSALVLPRGLSAEAIDQLSAGIASASRDTHCPVVGGNISRGGELSLTTTVLGHADRPLRRSGARPGEELWLIGGVGLAAAGLSLLRLASSPARGDAVENAGGAGAARWTGASAAASSPAATQTGVERCVWAWRRPRALLQEGRELIGRASAAIDVSDGLASDAAQLASASRVRVVVERERLRAALGAALFAAARQARRSALRFALSGGEDYALLATGPCRLRPACAVRIGYVARGSGAFLAAAGRLLPLRGGFDHLRP
jgi:thiamine-monophosphate kinase